MFGVNLFMKSRNDIFDLAEAHMEYLSIKQTSEKWGISVRRINDLIAKDRIPGAVRIGYYWAIPADAEKPGDARIHNGKYPRVRKQKQV